MSRLLADSHGAIQVPCDVISKLPPIIFTINGIDYPVLTSRRFMRTSALAALQEAQKALKGQRPGSLGDVFLRLYFSIFDRKKQQDWPGSCSFLVYKMIMENTANQQVLTSLRESKVTTNSTAPETSFWTNNVASARDELVHPKVVTAVEDKRFCIFIWHIFLVPVKTSFLECELSSDTCGVTITLPISIRSIYGSWLHKFKISLQGNEQHVACLCERLGQSARKSILEYHQVPRLQLGYHNDNNILEH
ncbi:hypothetical protein E5288_WYG016226 [Bos mutus]|uniref:Peptidase A1 domain-containing protein n=1 Tax=Bos mutus TaxID=72004 RepID=A0A6B0RU32_9CETA|nr:hypothetical protein [Bos mutus]